MKKRQQEALERAKFFGGDPEGKIGNSAEFRDIYEVTKGSRPWFVTDPPDGKIPGSLAGSAIARSGRGHARKLRQRTIQRPGRLQPVGALHHARSAWLDASGRLRQLVSDRAGSRVRRHPVRDGARDAGHPARRTSASRQGPPVRHGQCARPLGRRHARRRDDQLPAAQRLSQRQRRHASSGRAFPANGSRRVEWSVTVEDSATWARPWTFSMPLTRNEEEAVELYECHEGNHAIFNILSAARAAEREQAASQSR